jgi:hypothetical protein
MRWMILLKETSYFCFEISLGSLYWLAYVRASRVLKEVSMELMFASSCVRLNETPKLW